MVHGDRPAALKRLIEYDASGNPVYVGLAAPGTTTNDTAWQVQKITYDASGNPTLIQFAANGDYSQVWDNRASLTYA